MRVKTIKQGNSIIIPIPNKFNIPEGTEFDLQISTDGTIVLRPIQQELPKIWQDNPKDIKRFNDEIGSQDDQMNYGRKNTEV